jgi:hypothetical protein
MPSLPNVRGFMERSNGRIVPLLRASKVAIVALFLNVSGIEGGGVTASMRLFALIILFIGLPSNLFKYSGSILIFAPLFLALRIELTIKVSEYVGKPFMTKVTSFNVNLLLFFSILC